MSSQFELRDEIAMRAMTAAMKDRRTIKDAIDDGRSNHGRHLSADDAFSLSCYDMADAMLKARRTAKPQDGAL